MADYLTNLAARALGRASLVRPVVPLSWVSGPSPDVDRSDAHPTAEPRTARPETSHQVAPRPPEPTYIPLLVKTPPPLEETPSKSRADDQDTETFQLLPTKSVRIEPDRSETVEIPSEPSVVETTIKGNLSPEQPGVLPPVRPRRPRSDSALVRGSEAVRPSELSTTPHLTAQPHSEKQSSPEAERAAGPMSESQRPTQNRRDIQTPFPQIEPLPVERAAVERILVKPRIGASVDGDRRFARRSSPGGERTTSAAPIIRVTIGRIEVRASTPSTPPAAAPRARYQPSLTLDQYLKQRNESKT